MTDDLGPCCGTCQQKLPARTIVMLSQQCPIPGRGWGCLQCGLPSDGATAVLCGACTVGFELHGLAVVQWACRGWPATDGRVPIGELTGRWEHDMSKHPEASYQTEE